MRLEIIYSLKKQSYIKRMKTSADSFYCFLFLSFLQVQFFILDEAVSNNSVSSAQFQKMEIEPIADGSPVLSLSSVWQRIRLVTSFC